MYRAVSRGLGVLLLLAAVLKVADIIRASAPEDGWWADLRIKMLTVQWELILGGWLMSGYRPVAAWAAAVMTFVGFAGLSGYLGWVGEPSCGCFGATAKTDPRWSFALDAGVLLLLAFIRPQRACLGSHLRSELAGSIPVAAATAAVTIGGLMFYTRESVSDRILARVRGDEVTARPAFVDVGTGEPDEVREGVLEVSNWSDRPLNVFGGTTGCNYNILRDSPRTIAPGTTDALRVTYRFSATGGLRKEKVQLWAVYEAGEPFAIRFELGGTTQGGGR